MDNKALVSIILPTHNRVKHIKKAVESVLFQTYKNFELVIIDDASTDKTSDVVQKFARKDSRVNIITNPKNLGFVKSLNNGIRGARGIYIARLDDDDFWCDSQKLKKQVEFLENNPDYVLVGGGIIRIDEKGKEITRDLLPETDKAIRQMMLQSDPFVHTNVVFKKDDWEFVGGYDERFDYSQDWDLWMKLGKLGKYYNFQEYFLCYLQAEQNRSNKNIRHHLMLNMQLRKKYRKDFPNFWKAYLIGLVSYMLFFLPFRIRLNQLFLAIRRFILR